MQFEYLLIGVGEGSFTHAPLPPKKQVTRCMNSVSGICDAAVMWYSLFIINYVKNCNKRGVIM
jgi:hypothetical protein